MTEPDIAAFCSAFVNRSLRIVLAGGEGEAGVLERFQQSRLDGLDPLGAFGREIDVVQIVHAARDDDLQYAFLLANVAESPLN